MLPSRNSRRLSAPAGVEVGHVFYVWLQGESDAIRKLPEAEYLQKIIAFKDALKRDCGIEKFGIIRVGYFVGGEDDEVIMNAQERAVKRTAIFSCSPASRPSFPEITGI